MKALAVCLALAASISPAWAQPLLATALRSADSFASIADEQARSRALFAEAGKVLLHPRCLNCHANGDRPLQSDAMRAHQPAVSGGEDGTGAAAQPCVACHGPANFAATPAVTVPGHPQWKLAPARMAWTGKPLAAICARMKDRENNGYKKLRELVEHMAGDSLVGWSWRPGAGRSAAPGTQQQFGELLQAWLDTGAHCPAS